MSLTDEQEQDVADGVRSAQHIMNGFARVGPTYLGYHGGLAAYRCLERVARELGDRMEAFGIVDREGARAISRKIEALEMVLHFDDAPQEEAN